MIFTYNGKDYELGIARNKRHLKWKGKVEPDKYWIHKGLEFNPDEFHKLLIYFELIEV